MNDKLTKVHFLNKSIIIPYFLLSAIGIIMIFSTTVPYEISLGESPYKMTVTQGIFMLLSFLTILGIYKMKLRVLKNKKIIGIFLIILLSAMVYSRFGPGTEVNGAHRWIQIQGIGTIQPAEYAKIFIVWYLASVFSEKQNEIYRKDINALFKGKTLYKKLIFGWKFPIVAIILIEIIMPDLGSTFMVLVISGCMVAISGISWRWFSGYGKIFVGLMVSFIMFLYSVKGNIAPGHYINARFRAMVNPFEGLGSYGHQMANSYYAVINGGWFGRGLGNSIQKKGFLPEAHTDFIFAIVIEELGVIGGIIILALFFFMVVRILQVGINAKDPFNSMLSIGIAVTLMVSVFVNIGGAFGMIPESGVTFPFLSQGGSSFLALSIGIGFVLNASADEKRSHLANLSKQKL